MERKGKIPKPLCDLNTSNMCLGELFSSEKTSEDFKESETWKGEWLWGFKLPPFQRKFVWTTEQCQKFIESAWMGFALGTYVINQIYWKGGKIPEYDNFLIDGQQRLTAIKKYTNNEFPVFGYYFKDLDDIEIRRFKSLTFARSTVSLNDYAKLEELYNRLCYGGTMHFIGEENREEKNPPLGLTR